MATTTEEAYTIHRNTDVGTILNVRDVDATVPEEHLPKRAQLASAYAPFGVNRVLNYYLMHDHGMVELPLVVGDGSQSLAQLDDWCKRHGYKDSGDPLDFPTIYTRP